MSLKKLGIVNHTCHPGSGETDRLMASPPRLLGKFWARGFYELIKEDPGRNTWWVAMGYLFDPE